MLISTPHILSIIAAVLVVILLSIIIIRYLKSVKKQKTNPVDNITKETEKDE